MTRHIQATRLARRTGEAFFSARTVGGASGWATYPACQATARTTSGRIVNLRRDPAKWGRGSPGQHGLQVGRPVALGVDRADAGAPPAGRLRGGELVQRAGQVLDVAGGAGQPVHAVADRLGQGAG